MDVWSVDHAPYGLAANGTRDGGYNAVCILNYGRSPNRLYYHNKNNGSVLASYPITLADSSNYDITYDWRNKLIWRYNQAGNTIDGTDHTTGSVVASFASPLPGTVSGLAYKLRFLFLAYPDCIARVHCPVLDDYGTSVAPASMGGIKAIFR
jgi:ribosomal protein L35AE/L33A